MELITYKNRVVYKLCLVVIDIGMSYLNVPVIQGGVL